MRGYIGLAVFAAGLIGLGVGSRLQKGWENWNRNQRVVCSISLVVALAGLIMMG
ncbi:hypothetical protein [Kitasatospora cinereorecta]|uniref:Uncharacterized protein n=1 Tax=Kitasatospora cinereorecta TaxID=285560 RepID=A0ABW0VJC6_9ACTN